MGREVERFSSPMRCSTNWGAVQLTPNIRRWGCPWERAAAQSAMRSPSWIWLPSRQEKLIQ